MPVALSVRAIGSAYSARGAGTAATIAEARSAAFQELLRGAGVDAALLLNPPAVFYVTRTKQRANLPVPADEALAPTLFVRRGRGARAARSHVRHGT